MSDLVAGSTTSQAEGQTYRRPARRFMGLRLTGLFAIVAVAAVVCLVTLPRLADYVRHTNEADARATLALLGPICFPGLCEVHEDCAVPGDCVLASGSLEELSCASGSLRHRMSDARVVEDEARLLYHGYLFELRKVEGQGTWLVASPRRKAFTGESTYAWSPSDGLLLADAAGAWSPILGN
jgi:hypothetical protein